MLPDRSCDMSIVAIRERSVWNARAMMGQRKRKRENCVPVSFPELVRLLSDDQLAPLAAPIAAVSDIRIVPAALVAFDGRTLPPAAKAALRLSKIAAVASLGE